MEPVTTVIITALALGASAGLKSVAEKGVKEAYEELKQVIVSKYNISLSELEKKPDSKIQQAAVEESLKEAKGDQNEELLDKAKALIDLTKKQAPEIAKARGINLEDVEAQYFKAKKLVAKGSASAVEMSNVKITEGIEIEDVTVEDWSSDPNAQRQ